MMGNRGLALMKMNMKSDMTPVAPIAGGRSQEAMLSAIKNKRQHNAMKMDMTTNAQNPLSLPSSMVKIKKGPVGGL